MKEHVVLSVLSFTLDVTKFTKSITQEQAYGRLQFALGTKQASEFFLTRNETKIMYQIILM
jgi:hypothetical protein